MELWKATKKGDFNTGTVKLVSGMSVEFTSHDNSSASTVWQNQNRMKIAEALVAKYQLNCPIEKVAQAINNVSFEYTKL